MHNDHSQHQAILISKRVIFNEIAFDAKTDFEHIPFTIESQALDNEAEE